MKELIPKEYHQHIPHNPSDQTVISRAKKDIQSFEKRIISLHSVLIAKGYLPSLDPIRRAAEEIDGIFALGELSTNVPAFLQSRLPKYGERRILAVETILCEMGLLTRAEIAQAKDLEGVVSPSPLPERTYSPDINETACPKPQYNVGDLVQVSSQTKPGHVRTPVYLLGKQGKIVDFRGMYLNPEDIAHFKATVFRLPLYLVEFDLSEVWGQTCPQRSIGDKTRVEIYEPWLSRR